MTKAELEPIPKYRQHGECPTLIRNGERRGIFYFFLNELVVIGKGWTKNVSLPVRSDPIHQGQNCKGNPGTV